jgi:hypothetical protein
MIRKDFAVLISQNVRFNYKVRIAVVYGQSSRTAHAP